jgi:tetratricopeptide (TPR) repeat protein
MEKLHDKRNLFLICLALIVVTLAVYGGVGGYGFVYDDDQYIVENLHVHRGLTADSVRWAFTTTYAANWHPLTWLSHMLDVQLYGVNPGGHHITNLLLHLANVVLLFLLLVRLTGAVWRSGFVAALFAVHPLHVESVAWVSERKDVLSAFFWILTMWAYARYAERPGVKRYLPVFLLFALGLTAKPMLVTLPFVLLLMDYWPLNRIGAGKGQVGLGRLVLEKTPLFVLSAASSVVTYFAQQKGGAVNLLAEIPLSTRLANALAAYGAYIAKMFWPGQLAPFYPHPGADLSIRLIIGAALLLAAVSVLVFRLRRDRRYLATGWLWYLGTLAPVIGLVQVGDQGMADRYTYIPLIGLFIMIAWGPEVRQGDRATRRQGERAMAVLAALLIGALAVSARVQAGYWRDTTTLFTHTLKVTSNNYVAHNNLGIGLERKGKIDEAIEHYSEAVKINPNYSFAYNNLGNCLMLKGKTTEAMKAYREAVHVMPGNASAHYNLGTALAGLGRSDEAVEHYREAIRLDPEDAAAHYNLAIALVELGRFDQAVGHYEEALRLDPDDAQGHYNLGIVLAGRGRIEDAIGHFQDALRIRPEYAEAHYNLGVALVQKRQVKEAIRHYSEAIRLKPDYGKAHKNLAVVLYLDGDYNRAWEEVRLAQEYGMSFDPAFIQALSDKSPEP